MKVYDPILWDNVPGVDYSADSIEFGRVVPRVGQRRRAFMDTNDRINDRQEISCIWSPPYTDVNGWDDQPSEIALSYIVTGTAHLKSSEAPGQDKQDCGYYQYIASSSLTVEIDVHCARPLLDALALAAPDCTFRLPTLGTPSGDTIPLWLDSGEYISAARVAGYTYLRTQSCETQLEALVRVTDEQVVLAYHRCAHPCCESECVILNNPLYGDERAYFERLISNAELINNTQRPYLV